MTFDQLMYSVTEAAETVIVTVQMSGLLQTNVIVDFKTIDGSAIGNVCKILF